MAEDIELRDKRFADNKRYSTHQYKYGFSRSIFTEFIGSKRNHVVNVNPFSYGHFASGGSTIAWKRGKTSSDEIKKRKSNNLIFQLSSSSGAFLFPAKRVSKERRKEGNIWWILMNKLLINEIINAWKCEIKVSFLSIFQTHTFSAPERNPKMIYFRLFFFFRLENRHKPAISLDGDVAKKKSARSH